MGRSCTSTDPDCPVARAIAVLQEKWVLHIVHTLLDGPRGFNELGREVGGCNPTTLTQRLAKLEEIGLVTRTQELDGRGRSGYRLTASGDALSDVIEAIHAWSVQHLHQADPVEAPPLRLRAIGSRRLRERPPLVEGDGLSAG
jgi:DNA-binding HxlR family transcriptional regulator